MEKEIIAAIVGAIGGLVSCVVGAFVVLWAKRVDRSVEDRKLWVGVYDTKLLEQRLVEYKKLWKLTEPTSGRHIADIDLAKASSLGRDLTSWYYTDGGMLFSNDARNAFFPARAALESSEREKPGQQWHENVVSRFSKLRAAICEDMNSRRGPTLRAGED